MTLLCRSSFIYFAIFIFAYCIAHSKLPSIANQDCIRYRTCVYHISPGAKQREIAGGVDSPICLQKRLPSRLTVVQHRLAVLIYCRFADKPNVGGADLPHLLWPRPFISLCYTPQSMLAYGNGYFRPFLEIQYKTNLHHIVL